MDFDSFPQERDDRGQLRADWRNRPRLDRFPPDAPGYTQAMARHDDAVRASSAGYLDPTSGLFVMTAQYLANRGYCCDRGCRHCPYDPLTNPGI